MYLIFFIGEQAFIYFNFYSLDDLNKIKYNIFNLLV